MNKILSFFEHIKYEPNGALSKTVGAKLKKEKNQLGASVYRLELQVPEIISPQELRDFTNRLDIVLPKYKLRIDSSDEYLADDLFQHLIFFLKKEKLSLIADGLVRDQVSFDLPQINFEVISPIAQDQLKLSFSKIKEMFKQIGVIIATFEITKSEEGSNNIKKELESSGPTKEELALVKIELDKMESESKSPHGAKVWNNSKGKGAAFGQGSNTRQLNGLSEIDNPMPKICVKGQIFSTNFFESKRKIGSCIHTYKITDLESAIIVKAFSWKDDKKKEVNELYTSLKNGQWIEVEGDVIQDTYSGELQINARKIFKIENPIKKLEDTATNKRVPLVAHTKMSTMDGLIDVDAYFEIAKDLGYEAAAITDLNSVQVFPAAEAAAKKYEVKPIYGLEMIVLNDEKNRIVLNEEKEVSFREGTIISYDIETTGLYANVDEIIEFGAVKMKSSAVVDRLQLFIKPTKPISLFTTKLTGITDELLEGAVSEKEAMVIIDEWLDKDAILVAHNATFDNSFMEILYQKHLGKKFGFTTIDTLPLSWAVNTTMKFHRLGRIAKKYGVKYDDNIAHRADYDAEVLSQVFMKMISMMESEKVNYVSEINDHYLEGIKLKFFGKKINVLAKNQKGLERLFELVSISHTKTFDREPKILLSELVQNRENVLIGSSGIEGELWETILSGEEPAIEKLAKIYDYIEIHPVNTMKHLWQVERLSEENANDNIRKIYELAIKLDKLVVGNDDNRYITATDKNIKKVLVSSMGIGGRRHSLFSRDGKIEELPDQQLQTTNQLLDSFSSSLRQDQAYDAVISNTNEINKLISDDIIVTKKKLYPPSIPMASENLEEMVWKEFNDKYGENPDPEITKRLDDEWKSIKDNRFEVIYYLSAMLVKKSIDDGYLVGSRGSVGSSIVAYLSGISEINPIAAHYWCSSCKMTEFIDGVDCGYDLKTKECSCGGIMNGDGHNIPFATFLGFKGDKVPDIDLNFSNEYQSKAHEYAKKLISQGEIYRAGTISTVAERTAFGYVKNFEEINELTLKRAEIEYLASKIVGVKRTTGQHPGGLIVVPKEHSVHEFTPINYPADNQEAWQTTHLDFHSIHDNLIKLDLLGHVDPTALRMLQNITGIDPTKIPFNDSKVIGIFSSPEPLGIKSAQISGEKTGAIGIPEFGTKFVREMLEDTKPRSFADLVRISGLSHGTDVWLGNAKDIIQSNPSLSLKDIIACRDDIMVDLIRHGLDKLLAFTIMEAVRKGKGLTEQWEKEMRENDVPETYIDSCKKIKYMFPKAHASAYVLMAWRVAWFKVHHPLAYYATYFTTRVDQFEIVYTQKTFNEIIERKKEVEKIVVSRKGSLKDAELYKFYESYEELLARGFKILPVDVIKSSATDWIVDEEREGIIPPFNTITGLGESVANDIVEKREDRAFATVDDFRSRTKANKNHVLILKELNAFGDLVESAQMELDLTSFF